MNNRTPVLHAQFGPFTLITAERRLFKHGEPVSLTPKAFDLLSVLAAHPGRLLTKAELMQAVWPDTTVEESNLSYHVFAIRKALGAVGEANCYLETVPKQGYRFVMPLTPTVSPASSSFPLRPSSDAVRFQSALTGRLAESGAFAVSPDGRHVVFAAEGADGILRLWVRSLSALDPVPLAGTDSVFTICPPLFWSPDSRHVAFQSGVCLKTVALSGGAPQPVCEVFGAVVGGTWSPAGVLLLGNAGGGLLQCSAPGAPTREVTLPGPTELDLFPCFLPDGRHYLFLRVSRGSPERSAVYVGELDASESPRPLIATGFAASFVPAVDGGPGWIVFGRDGAVFVQRFDDGSLEFLAEPVRMALGVGSYLDSAFFSASARTLVYRSPDPDFQLTWFSRHGEELARIGEPARFTGLALSPHGDRALVVRHCPHTTVDQDLWLYDVTRNATPRRMTFEPTLESWPLWATNDRFVFGCGGGESGIYEQMIDGPRQLLLRTGRTEVPTSVTSDLRVLLYATLDDPLTRADVWIQRGLGDAAVRAPFIRREFDQWQATLSPDQRWVAYVSNENGPNDVYVAEFLVDVTSGAASAGPTVPVSRGGGFAPRWRDDGRELLYLAADGSVMSVDIDSDPVLRTGEPRRLFRVPGVIPEWGVTRDGERFLFAVPVHPPSPFHVVHNWQSGL